jgi:hypothetical protein
MTRKFEAIISILDKVSAPLMDIEEKMRKLGSVAKKTEVEIKEVGATSLLHARLGKDFHAIGQRLHHVGESVHEHLEGPIERVSKLTEKIVETLPIIGSLGALGSVAGLFEMTNKTSENVEALENQAKITGVSTEKLQQLNYAAKTVSVPLDIMSRGLQRLDMNLGKAAQGRDKQLVKMLQQLKIPLRDAHGHINSLTEILPKLETALAKVKSATLRGADAEKLFGRTGLDLLPLLAMDPRELQKLEATAKKMGYIFSEADKEGLQKFHRSMNNLDFAFSGLTDNIAATLAPALAPGVEMLAKFVAENKGLIAGDLKDGIMWLETKIKKFDWTTFSANAKSAFEVIVKGAETAERIIAALDHLIVGTAPIPVHVTSNMANVRNPFAKVPTTMPVLFNLPHALKPYVPPPGVKMVRHGGSTPAFPDISNLPWAKLQRQERAKVQLDPGFSIGAGGTKQVMAAPAQPVAVTMKHTHTHVFHGLPHGGKVTTITKTEQDRMPHTSKGQNGTIMQPY